MTSVTDILTLRRQEIFGRNLKAAIVGKFETMAEFQKLAFGTDQNGHPRGSGTLYPILNGTRPIRDELAIVLAGVLELGEDDWKALYQEGSAPGLAPPPLAETARPAPPAPRAKAPALPMVVSTPQLEFIIGQDGTGSVKLHVSGLALGKAMTLVATLANSGILRSESPTIATPTLGFDGAETPAADPHTEKD